MPAETTKFKREEVPIILAQEDTVAALLRGIPGKGGFLSADAAERMVRAAFHSGMVAVKMNPRAARAWYSGYMDGDGKRYLKKPQLQEIL